MAPLHAHARVQWAIELRAQPVAVWRKRYPVRGAVSSGKLLAVFEPDRCSDWTRGCRSEIAMEVRV